MKAKFLNAYRKTDNNGGYRNVFRYTVVGTPTELESYQTAQGGYYKETDEGAPLFFTLTYAGTAVNLVQTGNGNFIVDTSAFAQAEGMLSNFNNAEMRTAMAGILAKQFLGVKEAEPVTE